MVKRKRVTNVIKVDVDDFAFGEEVVPVLVQQSSKDGRRIEKTLHKVPEPRQDPLPSTFNPSPSFEDAQEHVFDDVLEPTDERNGPERVSLHFLPP